MYYSYRSVVIVLYRIWAFEYCIRQYCLWVKRLRTSIILSCITSITGIWLKTVFIAFKIAVFTPKITYSLLLFHNVRCVFWEIVPLYICNSIVYAVPWILFNSALHVNNYVDFSATGVSLLLKESSWSCFCFQEIHQFSAQPSSYAVLQLSPNYICFSWSGLSLQDKWNRVRL